MINDKDNYVLQHINGTAYEDEIKCLTVKLWVSVVFKCPTQVG